ncbi:lysozyme [Amycolatopsis taiwanensis]|uniref:lysozyme n=1 Tax=Amycolatopsis taiwanensis TaxID=342230 RepID=UPI000488D978|nr:lysozyme [Amycolatopsis taiwanensis]
MHTRRKRTRFAAGTIIAVAGVLLFGMPTPASADSPPTVSGMPTDQYVAKYDHAMGSQIQRVEGEQPGSRSDDTATVRGIDVSGHQGNVNWTDNWNQGTRFAYVKATEGTYYTNPYFGQQYNGSYDVGMIRGAYHFAVPNGGSGAAQANYFLAHGGGWSPDGKTLPGALDMEYNPYNGGTCYGLSKSDMAAWILDFSNTYHSQTNKWPVIYTSTSWWNQCVSGDFSSTNALWVARYASAVGALPDSWGFHTIWQYSSNPIDQDSFNGTYDRLVAFAANPD